jgi:hypothetical protein
MNGPNTGPGAQQACVDVLLSEAVASECGQLVLSQVSCIGAARSETCRRDERCRSQTAALPLMSFNADLPVGVWEPGHVEQIIDGHAAQAKYVMSARHA